MSAPAVHTQVCLSHAVRRGKEHAVSRACGCFPYARSFACVRGVMPSPRCCLAHCFSVGVPILTLPAGQTPDPSARTAECSLSQHLGLKLGMTRGGGWGGSNPCPPPESPPSSIGSRSDLEPRGAFSWCTTGFSCARASTSPWLGNVSQLPFISTMSQNQIKTQHQASQENERWTVTCL